MQPVSSQSERVHSPQRSQPAIRPLLANTCSTIAPAHREGASGGLCQMFSQCIAFFKSLFSGLFRQASSVQPVVNAPVSALEERIAKGKQMIESLCSDPEMQARMNEGPCVAIVVFKYGQQARIPALFYSLRGDYGCKTMCLNQLEYFLSSEPNRAVAANFSVEFQVFSKLPNGHLRFIEKRSSFDGAGSTANPSMSNQELANFVRHTFRDAEQRHKVIQELQRLIR